MKQKIKPVRAWALFDGEKIPEVGGSMAIFRSRGNAIRWKVCDDDKVVEVIIHPAPTKRSKPKPSPLGGRLIAGLQDLRDKLKSGKPVDVVSYRGGKRIVTKMSLRSKPCKKK